MTGRFAKSDELVLAPSTYVSDRRLLRWIVGSANSEPLVWTEFWTPAANSGSHALWPLMTSKGYDLTWGVPSAEGTVVPAAVHSWSWLWSDGPKPLRLWKRTGSRALTLVDLRGGVARGHLFRGKAFPVHQLGPVRHSQSLFRESCVLSTPEGDVTIASRFRFSAAAFVFLAELAGALDAEAPGGAPLEALELRLEQALGQSSSSSPGSSPTD